VLARVKTPCLVGKAWWGGVFLTPQLSEKPRSHRAWSTHRGALSVILQVFQVQQGNRRDGGGGGVAVVASVEIRKAPVFLTASLHASSRTQTFIRAAVGWQQTVPCPGEPAAGSAVFLALGRRGWGADGCSVCILLPCGAEGGRDEAFNGALSRSYLNYVLFLLDFSSWEAFF